MSLATRVAKRLVIGNPVRSDLAADSLLPIFASDALSSVAYATQEILLVLTIGGTAFLYLTPWIAAAVAVLMAVVVASYRQLVVAYPTGGGDYEVASKNIGRSAGVVVASALLVDYVMTVAVSVSSGVDNIISALPSLHGARVWLAVGFVVVLAAINLRGIREAGMTFAAPTYLFAAGVFIMIATGLFRAILGDAPLADSAAYGVRVHPGYGSLGFLALAFLALRAFSSGCTALTGVEAIANGVPALRPPKARNARITLLMMGTIATTMFIGITALALITKVRVAANPCDLSGFVDCQHRPQRTVIAQVASAVFGGSSSVGFFYIQATTALILVLAANTAFNGFPLLGSILAQDRNLPRQLHTRGDRLAYSNGILMLAIAASVVVFIFRADVTRLIQLYIIGVFTSFTLGQIGMVRHWNRNLRTERDEVERRKIMRSRVINATGAVFCGLVLVIVVLTKFTKGAYLVLIAMPLLYLLMRGIHRHYARVSEELVPDQRGFVLPARTHVVVLVSKLHKPTLRALAYARATRPDSLTALTVNVDDAETRALLAEWGQLDLPVRLTVLESPFREVTTPVIDYVRQLRKDQPNEIVNVYIPEYVVGRWWEHLLHNQSALRLKGRLLFQPGVMVTSVPWQLESSQLRADAEPVVAKPPGTIAVETSREQLGTEPRAQVDRPGDPPQVGDRRAARTVDRSH